MNWNSANKYQIFLRFPFKKYLPVCKYTDGNDSQYYFWHESTYVGPS